MATSETAAKRLLGIAVAMARRPEAEPAAFWQVFERVSHEPGCKRLLQQLTTTTIDRWQRNKRCRALRQRRREAKAKTARIQRFAPILAGLRVGHHGDLLDWAAQEYFDQTDGPPDQPHEIGRLVYLTDEATAVAIAVGWEYLATVDLVDVTAARLGAAETQSYRYKCGAGALAGLDRLLEKQRLPDLATMPIDLAIVVLHAGHLVRDGERRQRLERWAAARLDRDPSAGAATLHAFWAAALDAGATHLSGLSPLTADEMCGAAAAQAIDALLRTRRTIPPYALRAALGAAAKCLGAVRLLTLAESALDDPAVVDTQRTIWSFVAFVLAPTEHGERLLAARRGTEMAELFDDSLYEGLIRSLGNGNESDQTHRLMVTVRLFGSLCTLDDGLRSGAVTPAHHASDAVRRAINALGAIPHAAAGTALASLIGDPGLAAWHANLRHAHAQYARLRRDSAFQHPTPTAIREAIAGGPPVNAADLRAVVVEEIGRLQAELHAGNTTPWKAYWNTDSNGQVLAPRVENDCRDRLLERLHDRLGRYGIAAALPEARRGEEKRADVLFLSGAGRNLPLEAKRHRHADLWTAASTQLQGYAASEGADGSGIYLVFWFGVAVGRPPARPDGAPGPTSAAELQRMLVDDLAPELRTRTDVIVFDVSDSSTGSPPPPRPFGTRGRKSRARTGNPG